MTFEDAIAYSRNVVAAKVALRLGQDRRRRVGDRSTRPGGGWASARRPASTSPARSAAWSRDPATRAWRQIDLANGAFGQGVAVTPIQLAQAYAAMVNGGVLVQPHVVRAIGGGPRSRRRRGRVIDAALSADARRDDEPRRRRGRLLPRPDARSRATTSAARPARRRSGTPTKRQLEEQHVQLLVRRATSGARTGQPDLVVAVRIKEGTPTVAEVGPARDAGHVVRAVPADRPRRDHDARSSTARDRASASTGRRRAVTSSPRDLVTGRHATLTRDRRSAAVPRAAASAPSLSTAEDLARLDRRPARHAAPTARSAAGPSTPGS